MLDQKPEHTLKKKNRFKNANTRVRFTQIANEVNEENTKF